MNEPWKRLIEAERRLMRLESKLQRQNTKIASVSGMLQNQGQNVVNPFGTGGTTGGMIRFETSYTVRVSWSTTPTLINAASSNVAADGPALTDATTLMSTGFAATDINTFTPNWYHDDVAISMFQRAYYKFLGLSTYNKETAFSIAKYDGGDYLIDQDLYNDGYDIDERSLTPTSGDRFYLSVRWNRRNFAGSIIGTDTLVAMRTSGSSNTFTSGPEFGTSGTWSFAMDCPATTYHNAGSGTIYLDWG